MTVPLDEKSAGIPPIHPESPVLLVLLGASNLSRGCFAFARHMKVCLYPRKVDVLIASGPGRAYCASGGLLNVVYPPIDSSDIFEMARNKSESGFQVVALVTDIGNDIMYGVPTEKLIETLQQVFSRLQSMKAEIFYTTLPFAFEKGVHPVWFYILRSVLLPFSRVSYDEAVMGITQVNQFLRESAGQQGHLISDMDRYLGFDEIHYGWLRAHSAWSHVAKVMLNVMGIDMRSEISLPGMLKSYWEELRQVVWTDMMGHKKKKPEHF
ncbi:MAG: hypothetical protein OEM27_00400 [Nitrospinota bacterium]|nr:hypothetical protein [Nitrospinota bacterium]